MVRTIRVDQVVRVGESTVKVTAICHWQNVEVEVNGEPKQRPLRPTMTVKIGSGSSFQVIAIRKDDVDLNFDVPYGTKISEPMTEIEAA